MSSVDRCTHGQRIHCGMFRMLIMEWVRELFVTLAVIDNSCCNSCRSMPNVFACMDMFGGHLPGKRVLWTQSRPLCDSQHDNMSRFRTYRTSLNAQTGVSLPLTPFALSWNVIWCSHVWPRSAALDFVMISARRLKIASKETERPPGLEWCLNLFKIEYNYLLKGPN